MSRFARHAGGKGCLRRTLYRLTGRAEDTRVGALEKRAGAPRTRKGILRVSYVGIVDSLHTISGVPQFVTGRAPQGRGRYFFTRTQSRCSHPDSRAPKSLAHFLPCAMQLLHRTDTCQHRVRSRDHRARALHQQQMDRSTRSSRAL